MNPVTSFLNKTMQELSAHPTEHARTTTSYAAWEKGLKETIQSSRFAAVEGASEVFGPFGTVTLPYHRMGAVDTLDLFGLDELIIFTFYWANRKRYRRAADIGANMGLHSILMGKCGWDVQAYEPDPVHAGLLRRNLELNGSRTVELVEAAVSDKAGTVEFVRVLGNTTSSHLSGAKPHAYGQLERFPVRVESIASILPAVDFVKMDAEGQERIIILGTAREHWRAADMMVEVGTAENAADIYRHVRQLGLHAFAQKLGWAEVASGTDMPSSYKEGSLFITAQSRMNWSDVAS